MKNKLARIEKKESNDNSLPPFMQADPYQRRDQERSSSISKPPPTASEEEIDEDLKKAIELSLKEAERSKSAYGAGYAPPQRVERKATPPPVQQDEQEDPDLAAAIAASLQDMNISQNYASQSRSYRAPTSTDLSTAEMENILLFSTLMDRIRASSGEIGNDPEINALYTQIGAIQPKLVKSLDETNRKHRKY
jgi:growth factor-regulated tyrosine kinase substrate